jgi:hypothetical protein
MKIPKIICTTQMTRRIIVYWKRSHFLSLFGSERKYLVTVVTRKAFFLKTPKLPNMVIRTRRDPKMSNITGMAKYWWYDDGMACFRLLKVLTSIAPITITAIPTNYKKQKKGP